MNWDRKPHKPPAKAGGAQEINQGVIRTTTSADVVVLITPWINQTNPDEFGLRGPSQRHGKPFPGNWAPSDSGGKEGFKPTNKALNEFFDERTEERRSSLR